MDEKTNGLMMIVLGVVLAILYFAVPGLLWAFYWIVVAILILYGLILYLR